jgi:hypothetical protein
MTVGVITRMAASFESTVATSADRTNVTRKAWRTGPRVRGSISAASRSKSPSRSAVEVMAMTDARVMKACHCEASAAPRVSRLDGAPQRRREDSEGGAQRGPGVVRAPGHRPDQGDEANEDEGRARSSLRAQQ